MVALKSIALVALLMSSSAQAENTKVVVYSRFPVTSTIGMSGFKFASLLNAAQSKYEFVYSILAGAGGESADQRALIAGRNGENVLVWGTTSNFSINALEFPNSYDRDGDFIPVSSLLITSSAIVVPKDSAINTIDDLVRYLKNKDKIYTASTTQSNLHKLNNQAFVEKFDIKNVSNINYQNASFIGKSLAGNETDYAVQNQDDVSDSKALVTSLPTRNRRYPDVPTGAEIGIPDFQFSSLGLIYAPKERKDFVEEIKNIVVKVCKNEFADFLNSIPNTWYSPNCESNAQLIRDKVLVERSMITKYGSAIKSQ